ncbi:MAG: histidine phosphatase family protein [Acidimicrobiales bacterium]
MLGRLDVPLDDLGRRQAEALGRAEVLRCAVRVVTSPLERARHTAEALGPPVEVDPRWAEIDYGEFDGRPLEEAEELFAHWRSDVEWIPPGGESLGALGRRIREACADLWEEAVTRDVAVVTHVSPIKAAVAWALGVGDTAAWRMFLDVGSLSRIGPGRPVGPELAPPMLHSFNETDHRPSV